MNQLIGKYVNVILSVECGRGMDFLRNKVFITANFNGRILESDHIPPEESPAFNTELVWEIEKKELRKIRCGNLPLRVECITVDLQNRKERIGFALLSLRSAQIIPQSMANQSVTPVWHKLIGCQADKKKSHPELYLSLCLRDHLLNDQINIDCNSNGMPFIFEEDTPSQKAYMAAKDWPVKYFENGHIQIGNEHEARTQFTFNLKIIDVLNLDTLLPEALVFQSSSGSYFLTFKILGVIIKTKPFQSKMCSKITLNERLVVNLLSTKEILEQFFKTQSIAISFYSGYDKLGVTKLNVNNIWNKNNERHYFKVPTPTGTVPFGSSDKSPNITLETWIEENENVQLPASSLTHIEELIERPKTRSIFSNICKKTLSEIDTKGTHNTEQPITPITPKSPKTPKSLNLEHTVQPAITKSVDTVIISEPLSPRPSAVMDVYEKFVFIISLKYLIWTQPFQSNKVMFKFLHPRAASCTTVFMEFSNEVNKEILLNNVYVRLAYISTTDNIPKLLKYWQPKLVIADETEEYITNQCPINVDCFDNKSEDYEIELTSLKNSSTLAKVGVSVNLNIDDSRLPDDYENLFLLPVILDEIITINEVYDLEKWKEEKKSRFHCGLENLKLKEIQRLQREYDEKKTELEIKVSKTFEKCKDIQDRLKRKMNSMKFEKDFMKRENNRPHLYDDIFKQNWKSYSHENTKEIVELLSKMQRDNVLLKEICEEQKEELVNLKKTTLTKVEATHLLEELSTLEDKFSEATTAKQYFKEQFQKNKTTVITITNEDTNRLKMKPSRERLSTLKLENYPGFYTEQI